MTQSRRFTRGKKVGGGGPNFHRNVSKSLLRDIVATRYNNQTYRVDEINWEKTPSDEFDGRNGQKMSYQKYYAEKYNKVIRDPNQPLIITIPKISFRCLTSSWITNLQLSH